MFNNIGGKIKTLASVMCALGICASVLGACVLWGESSRYTPTILPGILLLVIAMNEDFVRERITALRLKKGVSEYQMSYDLGHSRGYIYNISSGKALPPLKEFFAICDYFGLTPAQFFDEGTQNPELIQKAVSGMKQLSEADLLMLLGLINRLLDTNNKSGGT